MGKGKSAYYDSVCVYNYWIGIINVQARRDNGMENGGVMRWEGGGGVWREIVRQRERERENE